jgi:DNA-directed RNA polymerase specialized sigma24 family protein
MSSGDEDSRLAAFFAAKSDDDAATALAGLFDEATERVLADSVRRGLFGSARRHTDADDIVSEARVRLIRRLWTLRRHGGELIEDFTAYAAATATRTVYAHLRARFPARTRFRNQVRYSVARAVDTVLEADAHGVWQCRSRAALRAVPAGGSTRAFLDSPAAFLDGRRIDRSSPLPFLIAAVLAELDQPIELARLVDALADALAIADVVPAGAGSSSDEHRLPRVPDPSPGAARMLSDREALEALWREVIALPVNQRVSLLLNLRDPEGGSALHALPATGVVAMGAVAAALELDERVLATLWDDLPLDDLTIGERLGVTRQQVINLRKSARARLARRTERRRA